MKIQLLIATSDNDYAEHLSQVLTEKYADTFEVSICSSAEHFRELARQRRFDVALLEQALIDDAALDFIRLPLFLWDERDAASQSEIIKKPIRKYQRISAMMGEVLEQYAEISASRGNQGNPHAHITAVWSPEGGAGKTTVALAYAAQKVAEGEKVAYLNLEPFSSTQVFFPSNGKSISSVFGKLNGDVGLLLQSIRQEDSDSGIFYFCMPDNYDDINVLTIDDVMALANGCASGVDALVMDLGSICDERTRQLLELADSVFLVIDASRTGQAKWHQFRTQHNIYEAIRSKIVLVANRGARADANQAEHVVMLPLVPSDDPVVVYKSLSAGYFDL